MKKAFSTRDIPAKTIIKALFLHILLIVLFCSYHASLNAKKSNHYIHAQIDSTQNNFISDYHRYILNKQSESRKPFWSNLNFGPYLNSTRSIITNNEIYEFSKNILQNYYINRIEMFNYKGLAYLYVDPKEFQSQRGIVQFEVNLPEFNRIFMKINSDFRK